MHGPGIIARSIAATRIDDKFGNTWQYHSRSDRHSKASCWGILFDLLQASPVFAAHVREGSVVFGINHEMRDFRNNRKKDLDLVISSPGTDGKPSRPRTFHKMAEEFGVALTPDEREILARQPELIEGPVGAVRIALEAKACMTAHVKAQPRLYDELNSSHLTVHGASDIAIACGLALVNASSEFVSADQNKFNLKRRQPVVNKHRQPKDCEVAAKKVLEIPRRAEPGSSGFDALALVVIDLRNDGGPVRIVTSSPAPQAGDVVHYDSMIRRAAQLYDYRFGRA